jgi:hypothetical protein
VTPENRSAKLRTSRTYCFNSGFSRVPKWPRSFVPTHTSAACWFRLYKGFLYKVASWKAARRVVAKVEHHARELFPRIGFIVTNLSLPSRVVVRFYNKRGTAEQWIKEGKQAMKMTRLCCHRFRSNEVRLWLSVIAYNLGNLWPRLMLPKGIGTWSLTSPQQRLVKTGEHAVTTGIAGGEPSHVALVQKHAAADGGFTAASRVRSGL